MFICRFAKVLNQININIMQEYVLRHWRGCGQIIPDIMKDNYNDYPKSMNIKPYKLKDCLYKVINQEEYLDFILTRQGVKYYNKALKKINQINIIL